ncbi:hypothetical protein Ahy_A08g038308 [Arachis hypogaea]|uniref:PB1-like domain-containing protein n=1 Tax=Arachis hypogaea TaxID=3818 RepID=A0A445BTG6_ARAHY|nr:hypothetical protein Ahy_A08g038308 [Arachis hypogaea]
MDRLVMFVYHHMGALKRGVDGNMIYDGGLVTEIHRVNVETCNLFFVEGLFLDLGYPGYNEVYRLEPGLDLGKGLKVLRTDAEVMRMCESAMKNDNTVDLYFDHPIDANPEIIDEEVVSDGSSDSVVEVNPGGDNVKEVEVTNKVDDQANEKENKSVNETSGEVNELDMVLSVVVKENVNEVVNEATVDVNESNKGESGAGKEAANNGNVEKDTKGVSALEKPAKKVRKRHPRPLPSGLPQERRAAENEIPESNPAEAEAVNEPTEETNADDVADLNEGSDFGEPFVDEQRAEEPVTESRTDNVTQTSERNNARRNHQRPQPSRQRIVPEKEDEAPRVEVPNPNREDGDNEPEIQPNQVNNVIYVALLYSTVGFISIENLFSLMDKMMQNNINDGNTTTNASPPNGATIPVATNLVGPTASSEPAPALKRRGRPTFVWGNSVPPIGRGSTTRRRMAATITPPTPAQNAAAAPLPPAQPRVVRHDVGSRSQIPASPSNGDHGSSKPSHIEQVHRLHAHPILEEEKAIRTTTIKAINK